MSTIFWGKKSLCNIQYRTWSNIYKLQSPVCVQVSVCVCTLPTAGCPVSVSEALNNKWHSSSPTPPPPRQHYQVNGEEEESAQPPPAFSRQSNICSDEAKVSRCKDWGGKKHTACDGSATSGQCWSSPRWRSSTRLLSWSPLTPRILFFFPLSYLLVKTCFWWSNCTVMVVNEFARNSDPRRRNMDGFILTFFLLFIKETHALRYGMANNLQPYMWVSFFSYLLFNLYFLSSEFK